MFHRISSVQAVIKAKPAINASYSSTYSAPLPCPTDYGCYEAVILFAINCTPAYTAAFKSHSHSISVFSRQEIEIFQYTVIQRLRHLLLIFIGDKLRTILCIR